MIILFYLLFFQNSSLNGLLNIFTDADVIDKYLLPDVHSTIVDKITKLCNNFSDWSVLPITRICFGKVVQLYSFILQNLNNKEILQACTYVEFYFQNKVMKGEKKILHCTECTISWDLFSVW